MTANYYDLECALAWDSADGSHRERLFMAGVDVRGSAFPAALGEILATGDDASTVQQDYAPGQLVPAFERQLLREIPASTFVCHFHGHLMEPRAGRFYPQAMMAAGLGCAPTLLTPCRILALQNDHLQLDLNHPLARSSVRFSATRIATGAAAASQRNVLEAVCAGGPGMQVRAAGIETDFELRFPLARPDDSDDSEFYARARLVQHLDRRAIASINALYQRFLQPGMAVLDLMSSWTSHLPTQPLDLEVTGLGMNTEELQKNPRLNGRVVHDLNLLPELPFPDTRFDLVLCTASVEYLSSPLDIFCEIKRVLKPGGRLVVTFSERWFPPKAIVLWTKLHPFERVGLVSAYFRAAGFSALHTETLRGLPRPAEDKYAATQHFADPLYSVWGEVE